MATIAQGIQAGNLANGLNAISAFVTALNAAVAADLPVFSIQIVAVGSGTPQISFAPGFPLSVSDSKVLMNQLVTLANQLSAQWTTQLLAL